MPFVIIEALDLCPTIEPPDILIVRVAEQPGVGSLFEDFSEPFMLVE